MASKYLFVESVPNADDTVGAIRWLIEKGVLRNEMNCPECNQRMELNKSRNNREDPLSWQCLNQQCSASEEISCRKGSYFEKKPPISLAKWLNIVKGFCDEETEEKIMNDVGLTNETVPMIYKRCRKLCHNILLNTSLTLPSTEIGASIEKLCKTDEATGTSTETHLLVLVDIFKHPSTGYMEILPPEKRDSVSFLTVIASVVKHDARVSMNDDINYLRSKSTHSFKLHKMYAMAESLIDSYIDKHKEVIEKIQEPGLPDPQDYLYEAMWRERYLYQQFGTFVCQLNDMYRGRK